MSTSPLKTISQTLGKHFPQSKPSSHGNSHKRRVPQGQTEATTRLERLSRGVLISTVVAVGSVGFGIVSGVSAQTQIDKVTGNMKPVVVTAKTIEAGTLIDANDVSIVEIPGAYLCGDVYTETSSFIGKTASVTIPANTQMSANLVADLGNTSSLAARIPAGQRAVTVNVTSSSGLSSLLRCGDNVQVYATTRDGALYNIATSVPVLALDGALSGPASGVSYSTVTLQVSDGEAQAIIAAEQDGSIQLVLNPLAEQRSE